MLQDRQTKRRCVRSWAWQGVTEISSLTLLQSQHLSDLTRKGQPNKVDWGDAQEKAYQTLQTLFANEPILHLPNPKKTYYLRTDASDYGVGAVLMQEHDSRLFSVCYDSKKLSNAEHNYSTIEECLTIVWAPKRFIIFLYVVKFVLQVEHKHLKYVNSAKFSNGRLMDGPCFYKATTSELKLSRDPTMREQTT